MKKFTRFLDLNKIEEQRRIEDEEKLISIGMKKPAYEAPVFDISRIEESINSGFISIPTGMTPEQIDSFLMS